MENKRFKIQIDPVIFNFWKGNKVTGFFQLTEQELVEKFENWLPNKENEWHEYYPISAAVDCFISEKEGLGSVGNSEKNWAELRHMEQILRPIRRKYLDRKHEQENSIIRRAAQTPE